MQTNNRIGVSQFYGKDYFFATYGAKIPEHHTFEDVLDPAYWNAVAEKVHEHSTIYAVESGGKWMAELFVIAKGTGWVKVKALRHVVLDEPAEDIDNEFKVEWKGPTRKWSIIRQSDRQPVKDGLESRDHAESWLKDNLSNLR